MFYYAYREFIRALGENDTKVLKKMTEPKVYNRLQENAKKLRSLNTRYYTVQDNIKMKMKLLDMYMIEGIYIDRRKNKDKEQYAIDDSKSTPDKIVFTRENLPDFHSERDAKFDKIFKDKQPKADNDISFMQVEI